MYSNPKKDAEKDLSITILVGLFQHLFLWVAIFELLHHKHINNVRPPIYELVNKSPSNYSYTVSTINHSYWSYVHQLSYLGGLTL